MTAFGPIEKRLDCCYWTFAITKSFIPTNAGIQTRCDSDSIVYPTQPGLPPLREGRSLDYLPRNPAAALAFASTSAIVPPVTQLPPTHRTGSNASQSGAVASVMPPVGQNLH